jgi:hypothetical protein
MISSSFGQSDPAIAPPAATLPEFRELLKGEDYANRFQKALTQIGDFRALEVSLLPITGLRVKTIDMDLPGWELGMRSQDIITKLEGQTLWSTVLRRNQTAPQTLQYFSRQLGLNREIVVQAGRLGIKDVDYWRPDLVYIRGKSRDAKWDSEVLVGVTVAETDPDLAETCWQHAIAKSYQPDAHATGAGIAFALEQGRVAEADAFASHARNAKTDRGEVAHPMLLYRAAIANYRLKDALQVLQGHQWNFYHGPEVFGALIALHDARPESARTLAPPSVLAAAMKRIDMRPRLEAVMDNEDDPFLPKLQKGEEVVIDAGIADGLRLRFSTLDAVSNCELKVRFKTELKLGDDGGAFKEFSVALVDLSRVGFKIDGGGGGAMLSCGLREGTIRLTHSSIPDMFVFAAPGLKLTEQSEHEIRMIRVGGQAELFLDGRRQIYLPVDESTTKLGLELKVIGAKGIIQNITFEELTAPN